MSNQQATEKDRTPDVSPLAETYAYRFGEKSIIAGRYRVIAQLGFGGFAEVYHCHDQTLNRSIALKVFFTEQGASKGKEEAQKMASLTGGPNIVHVYDFVQSSDGAICIPMTLLTGGTLEQKLDQAPFRRLSLEFALVISEQVGRALDYAHQKDIVHLDVKPSNILFAEDGQAFLSDFGLAEIRNIKDPNKYSKMTSSIGGWISGTIAYMSPEMVEEREVDYRSDIYTLGVVVYEALTGQLPYRGRVTAILANIAKGEPMPPREAYREIPERVSDVLLRVLDKDPAKRYASCSDFVEALKKAAKAYIEGEQLYEEGLAACEKLEWRQALKLLQQVEEKASGHKEVRLKLREVQDQVRFLDLYEEAQRLYDQGRYQECLNRLAFLQQIAADYSLTDLRQRATERLTDQNEQQAAVLYQQAQELFDTQQYLACKDALTQARQLDPASADPDDLYTKVTKILDRQAKLEEQYEKADRAAEAGEWEQARQAFDALHKEEPRYRDVGQRLATVEHMAKLARLYNQAKEDSAKDNYEDAITALDYRLELNKGYETEKVQTLRTEVLDQWYAEARKLLKNGEFDECLATLETLHRHAAEYGDPEGLVSSAQVGIEARKLRQELGKKYQEAIELLEVREFEQAQSAWDEIRARDETYPDSKDLERRVRGRLTDSLYYDARDALRDKDYERVLALCAKAQALSPHDARLEQLKIDAEKGLEQQQARKPELERQSRLAAQYEEAAAAATSKEWETAREKLTELDKQEPGYRDVHERLETAEQMVELAQLHTQAEVKVTNGEYEEAIAALDRLLLLNPQYEADQVRVLRAQALSCWHDQVRAQMQDNPEHVLEECKRIVALDPAYPSLDTLCKQAQKVIKRQEKETRRQRNWEQLQSGFKNAGRFLGRYRRQMLIVGAIVPGIVLLALFGRGIYGYIAAMPTRTPTPTATTAYTPTLTSTSTATAGPATPTATHTATATSAATNTPVPTATATATSRPTVTPTATSVPVTGVGSLATAVRDVSVMSAPVYPGGEQLTYLKAGEQATVLGRSARSYGEWFYVEANGQKGYAYTPYFAWDGDWESLPEIASNVTVTPSIGPTRPVTPLSIERVWWSSQCVSGGWIAVFDIKVQGGNGVYKFYWEGTLVQAEPKEAEQGAFFITRPGAGGVIVGSIRVESGAQSTSVQASAQPPADGCK